jgi:HEAT repeat protein
MEDTISTKQMSASTKPTLGRRALAAVAFLVLAVTCSTRAQETATPLKTWKAHTTLGVSPDGTIIASMDAFGALKLWNALTGEPIVTLAEQEKRAVRHLTFSPDGKMLAAGSGTLTVWNVNTKTIIRTLRSDKPPNCLAFSPDNSHIAAGSGDHFMRPEDREPHPGEISIWNVGTGKVVSTLKDKSSPIDSISYSPDGNYLASASQAAVMIWDLRAGKASHTLTVQGGQRIRFSPDGKQVVASVSREIRVWNFVKGKLSYAFALEPPPLDRTGHDYTHPTSLAFSPDSKYLISECGAYWGMLTMWDVTTGKVALTFKADVDPGSVIFSPDGKRLVTNKREAIYVWDLAKVAERTSKERFYEGKTLGTWLSHLASKDHSVRKNAVEAITTFGRQKNTVGPLLKAMKDENSEVREAACLALADFDDESVVVALINALKDKNRYVRKNAAIALATIGTSAKKAVPGLIEALKDEGEGKFEGASPDAVNALGYIGPDAAAAVDPLYRMLKEERALDPKRVIWALGQIGKPALPQLQELLDCKYPELRTEAARSLAALGADGKPAIPRLRLALKDDDPFVRIQAAHALASISPADVQRSVAALLDEMKNDKEGRVSSKIIPLLGDLGPKAAPAAKTLGRMLKAGGHSDIISALGKIGPEAKDSLLVFIDTLKSNAEEDGFPRYQAAIALGRMGVQTKIVEEALQDALNENAPDLRIEAAISLALIEPKNAPGSVLLLTCALRSPHQFVRYRAVQGLGELGSRAKAAAPELVPLLKDRSIQHEVIIALKRIDPAAAKQMGIP